MIMVFKIPECIFDYYKFILNELRWENSNVHNNLPNHHTCPADIILAGHKLLSRLICFS